MESQGVPLYYSPLVFIAVLLIAAHVYTGVRNSLEKDVLSKILMKADTNIHGTLMTISVLDLDGDKERFIVRVTERELRRLNFTRINEGEVLLVNFYVRPGPARSVGHVSDMHPQMRRAFWKVMNSITKYI